MADKLLQLLSVRIFQALLLPGRFDFDLEHLLLVVILLGFKSVIKIRGLLVFECQRSGKLSLQVLQLGIQGVNLGLLLLDLTL